MPPPVHSFEPGCARFPENAMARVADPDAAPFTGGGEELVLQVAAKLPVPHLRSVSLIKAVPD